ncbi:MAG: 4-(cytidine 5'-diphospho)-2-C-methyl-D-erythritol kinase [Gammaproteobacteria bacterium]|nr:4-(cytidine 5'-diphospho)-2-C-methyl-D-erythritol kinase [Gammaproteobacteria bacterium]
MIDSPLVWPAPAKLNLLLHITGQRADGYHELQTVFQFLDYGDELRFGPRLDGKIQRVQNIEGIPAEEDLVVKAARALQKACACQQGIDISLDKKLPMGAGLGGGSSDAATTLHALNRIWGCALSDDELAEIGLKLGADVPVFVHGFSAFAEGIGEQLTPIELDQPWYLVITPDIHVSTAAIFGDLELTRDCPAIKICGLQDSGWDNVCLPVVAKHYPEVAEALEILGQYAEARMSGTGASVFAAFATEDEAKRVRASLRNPAKAEIPASWKDFIAKGVNISPLQEQLNNL